MTYHWDMFDIARTLLGNDLLHHDTKVYINGIQPRGGDLRDIVLREGESIRIEFTTRN
jgi:hypothetical protein